MSQKRDNCIILLVDPPEADKISPDLKTAFGPERAVQVNSELLSAAYKLAKGFRDSMVILSYQKTTRHPDLIWLDPEDPGFLEAKTHTAVDRIQDAFRLAFFTGTKKAVLISHLSPELKSDWLAQAFAAVSDKTIAIGPAQDGSFYLLGLTQQTLKLLEAPGFSHDKSAETLAERARKNKLTVFSTPDTYAINSEETLLKWTESKNAFPPIFQQIQQAVLQGQQESKRHHRRHGHGHRQEAQVQPPPEKPPV